MLANRARLDVENGEWVVHGDPTEAALLVAGRRAGMERADLLARWPEEGAVPFTSERRYMATRHRTPEGGSVFFLKGDPGRAVERATHQLAGGRIRPMDAAARERLRASNSALAEAGLRVLALGLVPEGEAATPAAAERASSDRDMSEAEKAMIADGIEGDRVFVALAGMIDPAVPGVRETVARFHEAGIRTVMITGDQRPTAEAIARTLGLLRPGDITLDGRELRAMGDDELVRVAGQVGAFARVSPEEKLRIVGALMSRGEIVAMLGDGVNDAAALKRSNIGVAMGMRGTDVAREASDVVLTDDRFETVSAAIEEGRVIYDNIRKFVFFLFSCNLAEVLVLMVALLAGFPLPLTPLQILWMNLVTDTFPALALALEPADPDIMKRPPRNPQGALLSRAFLLRIAAHAAIITTSSLGAFLWAEARDAPHAVTICFMTLALSQIFHLGNARSRAPVVRARRMLANRWAVAAVVVTVALQVSTVLIPPLRLVLNTALLPLNDWLFIAVFSLIPAVVGQVAKLLRGTRLVNDS